MYTQQASEFRAQGGKHFKGRAGVMAKLGEIEQLLEDDRTSTDAGESEAIQEQSDDGNGLVHSVAARRVLLHPNQQVDIQHALLLNRVYTVESRILEEIQKFLVTQMLECDTEGLQDSTARGYRDGRHQSNDRIATPAGHEEEEAAEAYRGASARLLEYVSMFWTRAAEDTLADGSKQRRHIHSNSRFHDSLDPTTPPRSSARTRALPNPRGFLRRSSKAAQS